MTGNRLSTFFFNRPTLKVAEELIGKFLVRKIGNKKISAMIIETEAYCGPRDLASHASKGKTKRTEPMFGPPGYTYIYLIYGMHHCLNIVTEREDYPAAVLIRAIDVKSINGPGKICRYFEIDKKLNSTNVSASKEIWLEDRKTEIPPSKIAKTKRVNIDYAGKYKDKLWRFVLTK